MKRRDFIAGLGGAAVVGLRGAWAQQGERVRRVGMLLPMTEDDAEGQARAAIIRQGLERLGWKLGGTLQIDYRWAAGDMERLRAYAAELVALKPHVLVASATNPLAALARVTSTVPIVFVQAIDPVGAGYVKSFARPGGNITGFSVFEYGLATKWLELIKEIAPNVNRVGVVHEPTSPQAPALLREIQAAATTLGIRADPLAVRDQADIERSVDAFGKGLDGGLILLTSPLTVAHRNLFIDLAARQRLPCIYPVRHFVASGGLASYGIDNHALYVSAVSYVDRILKGEKPADLPVQAPTKYELAINLKTAKALGLTVPPTLLARADEVIE